MGSLLNDWLQNLNVISAFCRADLNEFVGNKTETSPMTWIRLQLDHTSDLLSLNPRQLAAVECMHAVAQAKIPYHEMHSPDDDPDIYWGPMPTEEQYRLEKRQDLALALEKYISYVSAAEQRALRPVLQSLAVESAQSTAGHRLSGLDAVNQAKAAAKKLAREIAQKKWSDDVEQEIRLKKMADIVWPQLIEAGHSNALPDSADGLLEWFKDIAPKYASKPGRPKKPPGRNG